MKRVLFAVSVFVLGLCTFAPRPVLAAEQCNARVDSVDEDRRGYETRPIWTGSLFAVSLLARGTMPSRAQVRVYVLGGAYEINADHLRWYPTTLSGVYRSAPIPISFDESVTFLHAGLSNFSDSNGFHDCVPRLFGAFSSVPNLTLAPIERGYATHAQPTTPRPVTMKGCAPAPARIAVHAPTSITKPPGAPTTGGPFVSLIAVRVDPSGAVRHTRIEVSSGFPWLDEQTEASARQQTYAPASFACKSASGLYYFAGRLDTDTEGDLHAAF